MSEDTGSTEDTSSEDTGDDPEANLDDAVKGILAKERKAAREADRRAKAAEARAKTLEDAGKTADQKATEAAAEAVKRAEAAEARALRFEVAADKGLPLKLAQRLVGSNRDELEADADELVKTFGKPAGAGKDPDQGRQSGGTGGNGGKPASTDMNAWMRTAVGRSS